MRWNPAGDKTAVRVRWLGRYVEADKNWWPTEQPSDPKLLNPRLRPSGVGDDEVKLTRSDKRGVYKKGVHSSDPLWRHFVFRGRSIYC